jgi:membrane-associated protease RseP (regulator of RpoE activity)
MPPIVILCSLVGATLVHELGHWLAARLKRGRVTSLRIGMGPLVWRGAVGETEYSLALVPLGGRIEMQGVRPGTSEAVVAASGALANLLAAFSLFLFGSLGFGLERMPSGAFASGPLPYAIDRLSAWMWFIPRAVASSLGLGSGSGESIWALWSLARDGRLPEAVYFVAGISVLWGVLNLVPVPGLRSDGWLVLEALLRPRPT